MASRTAFSSDDEARILAQLPQYPLRDQALFVFGLRCGFRATELGRLTVGHVCRCGEIRQSVTLERACLKGGRGVHRRSVRARTVPLVPALREILRIYLVDRYAGCPMDEAAPLFLGRGGGLSRWQINRLVNRIARDAGCEEGRTGSHSLRKTFAERVYRSSGYNINLTRQALGHQSVNTTIKYLSVDTAEMNAAILAAAALPPQPLP